MKLKLQSTILIVIMFSITSIYAQKGVWKIQEFNGKINNHATSSYDKNYSKTFTLNFTTFKEQLKDAPLRGVKNQRSSVTIKLPDEKGNLNEYNIFEAPVFAPSLSAKYPNIKSYVGYRTDNSGGIVRMSVSHKGVQTMISNKNQRTIFMQPVRGETEKYLVYSREAKVHLPKEDFICYTEDELVETGSSKNSIAQRDADDQILRKFRIAISVNGEYTAYHGGTVADALAAINATMTRNNAIYEVDMAVTFELQDFPNLIYTDAATDPYSPSLSAWNVELQNTLTNEIGNDAYDIGHMFGASGGGGNAGCIGCVCVDDTTSTSDENKGAGITSPADGIPEGDTFDVDYVAHEIGHQMGANHTFSHSTEGTGVNSEPGSGTTIMGYAGITNENNVAQHSDAYFHYQSIRQITDNITNTRLCWQANSPVTLTNNPPNADAGSDYTIPQGTAYVLRGTATDADGGDNLSYCWEGIDSGQVTNTSFGPTSTVGSMARSLPPTDASDRYIPMLSSVIAGNLTETSPTLGSPWETVATVSRDINWALTVRDREPTALGLGGQSSFDTMKVTVDASAGPFVVTSHATDVSWDAGTSQAVTWDVAGTDSGAVNATTVDILLSTDGGLTFPFTIATDVPNTGSYNAVMPSISGGNTTTARLMVQGHNHIFYAVNSSNFSVTASEFTITLAEASKNVCLPDNTIDYTFTYNTFLGFTGTTSFSATALPSGVTASFSPETATADATEITMTLSGTSGLSVDSYPFTVKAESGSLSSEANGSLNVYTRSYDVLVLTSPADASTDVLLNPVLTWEADTNATSYNVEVASDAAFTNIVDSANVSSNTYTVATTLDQVATYYWRVKQKNDCGEGSFSSVYSFTTLSCTVCDSTGSTTYATSTTLVQFNEIDNASGKPSGYSDYTSISTIVTPTESYDLTVNVNTDGNYLVQTKVWVDWNQNCSFDDPGEEYTLGSAANTANGPTDQSPLSITIPSDAVFGNTTMRVSSKYSTAATSCETSFDGEVEDYTLVVREAPKFALNLTETVQELCLLTTSATYTFTYNTFLGFTDVTTFSAMNLPAGVTASFSPASASVDATEITVTLSGVETLSAGQYSFKIKGESGVLSEESDEASLNVYEASFDAVTLTAPVANAINESTSPIFTWNAGSANVVSYDIEIATDSSFTTIVESANVTTNSYNSTTTLTTYTTYYWRVRPKNNCGDGDFTTAMFTTYVCATCPDLDSSSVNVKTVSESCVGQQDGSIVVEGRQNFDYTVTVSNGGGTPITQAFTGAGQTSFTSLAPGTYEVCATIAGATNYEQCFEVTIGASQDISLRVSSKVQSRVYSFEIDAGTPPYKVLLNDKLVHTSNTKNFDLELQESGKLEVKTAKSCEGTFTSRINGVFLMQNPVSEYIHLNLPLGLEKSYIDVTIFDVNGKLIVKQSVKNEDNNLQIPFENFKYGVYILNLGIENVKPIKFLKQ